MYLEHKKILNQTLGLQAYKLPIPLPQSKFNYGKANPKYLSMRDFISLRGTYFLLSPPAAAAKLLPL